MSAVAVNPADSSQYRIQAQTTSGSYLNVSFYQKTSTGMWTYLGSDQNPYFTSSTQSSSPSISRLFVARNAYASKTSYAFKAVVTTPSGKKLTSKIVLLKTK
jgi:hypothetical protein